MPHSAESFRRGKHFLFYYCRVSKSLDKRVGVSRFSVETFFPHTAESFRRGVPFSVSISSGIEKVWVRGGGEYQNFPSKFVCLTVPKNSVDENPLVFHYFRVPKKFMLQWVMSRFSTSRRKFFVSQCRSFS